MSIFSIVYLDKNTESLFSGLITNLSLFMLAFGLLGIGLTVFIYFKSQFKRKLTSQYFEQSQAKSATNCAKLNLAP